MKRTIQAVLLLVAMAGIATAGTVMVDFTSLTGPINITDPLTSAIGDVQMQYNPQGDISIVPPPPVCAFDGTFGMAFDLACVGAQIGPFGVNGTTEGEYILSFLNGAFGLQITYGLFSFLPPPGPTDPPLDFSALAVFISQGMVVDAALATGDFGTLTYDTSSRFDQAHLYFSPFAQATDPNTGLPVYGQTLASILEVSYAESPEPGTFVLLACGLIGIGGLLRRRVRT